MVWIWKGCSLDWCFPSVFGIIAKFLRWKFGNISPYFRGRNPATLYLRCIIAHKTLFFHFWRENTAIGLPHFYDENLTEFCVWCAMTHQQDFVPVYTVRANVLMLGQVRAPQSIKHVDTCRVHGETDVTWWHGSGRWHCDDYAHSMTRICTYNRCLDHILMPQGQEHSWLERVAHVAIRVHHTKCTITHTHTYIHYA